MAVKEKVNSHPGVVDHFKEPPFYNSTSKNERLNP